MKLFVPESSVNKRHPGVNVVLIAHCDEIIKSPFSRENHDFSMEDCDIMRVACQTGTVSGTGDRSDVF